MIEKPLTYPEHMILTALLDDVPLTILELAEKTRLPHQTVVLTLPHLGEQGYLVMGGDEVRKKLTFTLTHAGSALITQAGENPASAEV